MDKGRLDNSTLDLRLTLEEFLHLVKVIKMLYGREIAEKYFTKGLSQIYNIDSASLSKLFNKG